MQSMANRDGGRGRPGVLPPVVVLPTDQALAEVAKEAIELMSQQAQRNVRAAFTNEELRAAVADAQPHNLYALYVILRDGTVPRTPSGDGSEIGERLRQAMLKELGPSK